MVSTSRLQTREGSIPRDYGFDLRQVRRLLESRADTNRTDEEHRASSLWAAACNGHLEVGDLRFATGGGIPSGFLSQWENFKFVGSCWAPYLVLMRKVELFIPWWLERLMWEVLV